jgi:SMP-30/Gluconolactonase/LRE-like region
MMPETHQPTLPELARHGTSLNRPECVLAHVSGFLFAPDWTGHGGISVTDPDGSSWMIEARDPGFELRPNGIALNTDGSFLVAHLGPEHGGIFRLLATGTVSPVLVEIDGKVLPPCNFVYAEKNGALWISVSTRQVPRAAAYRSDVADGFLIRVDHRGARIVADNLGYTNECVPSPDGRLLYVNETFARRLSVFDINPDGSLSGRRVLTTFGEGTFPDGLAFDVEGHAWITSIVSNRVIRVAPDGTQQLVIEDSEPAHLAWVEDAYRNHAMGRSHLDGTKSRTLKNISSLAFGGLDLKTAHLGCLLGQQICSFRTSVAGHPLPHWHADITPILSARGHANLQRDEESQ